MFTKEIKPYRSDFGLGEGHFTVQQNVQDETKGIPSNVRQNISKYNIFKGRIAPGVDVNGISKAYYLISFYILLERRKRRENEKTCGKNWKN